MVVGMSYGYFESKDLFRMGLALTLIQLFTTHHSWMTTMPGNGPLPVGGSVTAVVGVGIDYPNRRGKAAWPADPEKRECVSDGTFSKP